MPGAAALSGKEVDVHRIENNINLIHQKQQPKNHLQGYKLHFRLLVSGNNSLLIQNLKLKLLEHNHQNMQNFRHVHI